ncbi:MAG: aminomethyl transferase family protein [Acidimicrobiia bacterium]|nr:aminomethyl transferase family protein [Acidimicrobiia bacterium]
MLTTPFHDRLAAMSETQLWEHWAGYLSAVKYQHSETVEYFAMRDAVGVFDTTPLFKYCVAGEDAVAALRPIFVRDIWACPVGGAQYNIFCNDAGFVLEDAVLLRVAEYEFWITTAGRNLRYFSDLIGWRDSVDEARDQWGMLAIQGRHSLSVLSQLTREVANLGYFGVASTAIAGIEVMVSRTGFTGDLGYELWVPATAAVTVFDALFEAGEDYNIIPAGARALGMARIEAGLLLLGTDFESARFAWTAAERESPHELGLGWMVPKDTDRPYIGKQSIEAERDARSSRWVTTGFIVDAGAYEATYNDEGFVAPKEGVYRTGTMSLYDKDFNADASAQYVGYATSFMFSPVLKRHIGLAKIPLERLEPGSELYLELVVAHRPKYVRAEVAKVPFYNPPRKTARHEVLP